MAEHAVRYARTVSRASWNVILPLSMATQDADVIQAVLAGDVDRYAELVDRYQEPALKLAFSLLGNYEDAKDVSQEAFLSAYRALARFRGQAKFSTWLFRIVINECKDAFKHRSRRPMVVASVGPPDGVEEDEATLFVVDVDDPAAGPREQLAQRELAERLAAAIGRLPMKQRTAFVLHRLHGLALEDAAAVMRCRVGTVKSHVFRATESLRQQLTPWVGQEGL